jgi:hypothetical protein
MSLFRPAQPPQSGPASDFYTVRPCRLIDTSMGLPLASDKPRILRIAGAGCSISPSAMAVVGNLTVTGQGGSGVLRLQPDIDRGWFEVVFAPDTPRSVGSILMLSPEGALNAVVDSAGPVGAHLQLDVSGYFLPAPVRASATPQ